MNRLPVVLGLLLVLGLAGVARAHRPHDVIWVLGIAPDHPEDGTIFASITLTRRTFFARSTDGGLSWQEYGHPMVLQVIRGFAFSPEFASDSTAFAFTKEGGVWRTTDGGDTWRQVNVGLTSLDVRAVAVPLGSSWDGTVAAATADGLFVSPDGGQRWADVTDGLTETDLTVLTFGYTSNVLFTGNQVVHRSEDGGRTWAPLARLATMRDLEVAPVPGDIETLAAAFSTGDVGVMISEDGGLTFAPSHNGLYDRSVNDVAWSRDGALYAATRAAGPFRLDAPFGHWSLSTDGLDAKTIQTENHYRSVKVDREGTVILGSFEGLYVSTDRGESWDQREVYGLQVIRNMVISPDFANDRTVYVGAYGSGPMRGIAGTGDDDPLTPMTWTSLGTGITLYSSALTLSPDFSTDDVVYYGYTHAYRSPDRGETWVQLPKPFTVNIVRSLALSPDYARDRVVFMGSGKGGSYRSENSGHAWSWLYSHGLPAAIQATWIVPSSDYNSDGTVFHTSEDHGVHRSTNQGQNWLSVGLADQGEARCLAVSPDHGRDHTLMVGVIGKGIMTSRDAGNSWTPTNRGLGPGGPVTVESIVFSPGYATDRTVFAATWSGAVYKSTDGGLQWTWSGKGLPHESARTLVISPDFERDGTLFTSNHDWLYRSTDAGETWDRMNGRLRVDNAHQSVRYGGGWASVTAQGERNLDKTYHQSNSVGDWTELRFYGNSVGWYARLGPGVGGVAAIELDGEPAGRIELVADEEAFQREVFFADVSLGWHVIRVTNAGTDGDGWTGSTVRSDGFAFTFPGQQGRTP